MNIFVSYNRFIEEIESRNIVILEEDGFLERLDSLAELFNSERLHNAIEQVRTQSNQ